MRVMGEIGAGSEQSAIEVFVVGQTFAAPFVSETVERYIEAESAEAALMLLAAKMKDGIGLYAANAYANADDYHRDHAPLAQWRSNKALAVEGAGSIYSEGPGRVEVDGEWVDVDDPKWGRCI